MVVHPPRNDTSPHREGEEAFAAAGILPSQSAWETAWQNNKGVFFILISEIAGSTMDAIVRFLQQGRHGMHPFQVSASHYL